MVPYRIVGAVEPPVDPPLPEGWVVFGVVGRVPFGLGALAVPPEALAVSGTSVS
jgi:hypothetical protein